MLFFECSKEDQEYADRIEALAQIIVESDLGKHLLSNTIQLSAQFMPKAYPAMLAVIEEMMLKNKTFKFEFVTL